jgi:hypothetical protein
MKSSKKNTGGNKCVSLSQCEEIAKGLQRKIYDEFQTGTGTSERKEHA